MSPEIRGQDLRIAFDRPEFRIMIVADKFQTGFDQPKLVAMYLDKKIANEVEIVQTLSRLNRKSPGKDQTFIIDFVNDSEAIRKAFARYDAGAMIEEVQDLNVIYDMKTNLDREGIYNDAHLQAFREAPFQVARKIAAARDPEHKAIFAATHAPTDTFNGRLKDLRNQAEAAEATYQKARQNGNESGMKQTDHEGKQIEGSYRRS